MVSGYDIAVLTVVSYLILGWLVLFEIRINYGRLQSSLSKILISPRWAWFIFEGPNLLWFIYFWLQGYRAIGIPYLLFLAHYINRDIIYPLRMQSSTKVPFEIMVSAFTFTLANGYLQALANIQRQNSSSSTVSLVLGCAVFLVGMAINVYSDNILQRHKKELNNRSQSKKYALINEFLFSKVSNPNYLGEIIEWIGYAIAANCFQGWLFALSTFNVLVPAAIVRNRWNKLNIGGYPHSRKAVIPFVL